MAASFNTFQKRIGSTSACHNFNHAPRSQDIGVYPAVPREPRNPKLFHALSDIAWIYLMRNDYDSASTWAKKCLKVNPKFIDPVAHLIIIALIKKENSLDSLIQKIEIDRRRYLKEDVELKLEILEKPGYLRKVAQAFKSAEKNTVQHSSIKKPLPVKVA